MFTVHSDTVVTVCFFFSSVYYFLRMLLVFYVRRGFTLNAGHICDVMCF